MHSQWMKYDNVHVFLHPTSFDVDLNHEWIEITPENGAQYSFIEVVYWSQQLLQTAVWKTYDNNNN